MSHQHRPRDEARLRTLQRLSDGQNELNRKGRRTLAKKIQFKGTDGKQHRATVVDVDESTERWTVLKLSDGTTLRAKIVVLSVSRIDDQFDSDRNPVYAIKSHNVLTVDEAPEELKAKVQ